MERMLADRFEVVCAADALEAVRALRYRRPDAILAELSVKGGGLRLAEILDMNVKVRHTPFILTCLKPSEDLVAKASKSGVDEVLVKPFSPSDLLQRLEMLLREEVLPDATDPDDGNEGVAASIRERMAGIDGLPSFPATHAKILELANSDKADSDDIAEQIQMDPGFLADVLRLANSSCYGFQRKVDSLKLAVTLVGFREIAHLVVSLQVFKELDGHKSESGFDLMAFWRHSVGTAFVARIMAQKLKAEAELCFMAGLLHDIGKVVLDRYFTEFYGQVLEVVRAEEAPSFQVEHEILGVTHAHVGGYLACNWDFTDALIETIVCHHDPSLARRYPKLASVVHVANAVCNHLEFGSSGEVVKTGTDDPVLKRALWKLGVGPHAFEKLVGFGKEQLEDANSFLNALMGGGG